MTDVNKNPEDNVNIYPRLSNVENIVLNNTNKINNTNRREFVLYVVDENMKRLNRYILDNEKKAVVLQKTSDILSYSSICLNTIGVGATTAGFGTALSGLGIIVAVPLGIVAATSGFIGGICNVIHTKLSKKVVSKLTKLKTIYDLRTRVNILYAKSINDDVLDEHEFKNLMFLMSEFEMRILSKYEDNKNK